MKLAPNYEASANESTIYSLWQGSGLFVADPSSTKEHFSIMMPPPNETGTLHIGHALGTTLQDIMSRHARQQGKDVLWLPGTDHAAIATNAIIEEQLRKEGTNKHQIGREAFLKRTREFVADSRSTINLQLRAMGASVDWTRSRYTLSPSMNRMVNEVFVKMYRDGLIYRGYRIVNWDPKLETNVSDDEVEYQPQKATLYTLKYGPFEIATARPETKFGDKYVVMHPDDKRYLKYKHGDQLEVEWINGPVTATVIKDEAVDPKFGTGVMTITPWHSQIDFEIAERHQLDREQIIGLDGRLLPIAQEFSGLLIEEARDKIVDKLEAKGLLVEIKKDYDHNVALNSRGHGLIEPQIRLQWFIDVNKPAVDWHGQKLSLKEVMQTVIREGESKIIPASFEKLYFHWVDNLRDWCISRQIWWGHQVPVWYRTAKDGKEEVMVDVRGPQEGQGWQQDGDTLDTWFSSALWTFSTLIDPIKAEDYRLSLTDLMTQSPDFQAYHPTTVLETAWDILFFWVARIILTTTYVTGQVPFKTVYLHGLVLEAGGRKMSKSKPETIIDPIEIINAYGTDSLRLALIQGMSPGNSQKLVKSKVIANRNFCNKLWNIARYIENVGITNGSAQPELKDMADNWIIGRLIATKDQVTSDLDHYSFSDAYYKLYHFVWDDLADWYIEASKINPNPEVLTYVLKNSLILIHPIAPYVTEVIWQQLFRQEGLLAGQSHGRLMAHDQELAKQFDSLKTIVTECRYILQGLGEKNARITHSPDNFLDKNRTLIEKLTGLSAVRSSSSAKGLKLTGASFNIWLDIDHSKAENYLKKLDQKLLELKEHIDRLKGRLSNASYIKQAPEEVIADSRQQLADYQERLEAVEQEVKLFRNLKLKS